MKEIWFIRHGESMANAGHATADSAAITLTPLGHQQAKDVLTYFEKMPDLIIVTPYLRTQQTAAPSLEHFSEVPLEIWPFYEFEYLSPSLCVDTTVDDRRPMVKQYWSKCDPDLINGQGAESFREFYTRVIYGFKKLEVRPETFIVVFAHGHVMRAILQYLSTGNDHPEMKGFRDQMLRLTIANTAILKCGHINQRWHSYHC